MSVSPRATPGILPSMLRTLRVSARTLCERAPLDPYSLEHRDPETVAAVQRLLEPVARGYLRVAVRGTEHIRRAPALYVGNHSGGIFGPDLLCTLPLLWRRLGPSYPLYAMIHDLAMRRVAPLGRLLQRVGGMRADPHSAARVFARGGSLLAYPGGDLDAYRSFRRRHQVVFGERTGFVRVAREAGVPIVPVVAAGAHRSAVIVHEGAWLARALGLRRWSRIERFPIALALPWGVAAGPWVPYLPLPWPIQLQVLPPVATSGAEPPRRVQQRVVDSMQAALSAMASGGWA